MFVVAPCLVAGAGDLAPSATVPPPLGEWSKDCNPGFKLSAMPRVWSFSAGGAPLVITVRPAIDFEYLSTDAYTITRDRISGERVFDLSGFDFMVLEAEIRHRATGRVVKVLPGVYLTDDGKEPMVFEWDGRSKGGSPVRPGFYEIEVRGRFVPVWAGVRSSDGYGYRDFDGWSIIEEACRRIVTVEITKRVIRGVENRGVSCAAPPASYYSTVDAADATTLRATLHPVIDDHTKFPYSSTSTDCWDILNDADENPSNASQLLSIYKNEAYADGCSSGCDSSLGWNREHTWAKSFGFSEDSGNGRIPYTDCHHLRAADQGYNSSRNNNPHNNCTGDCTDKPTDANNGFGGGAGDVNKRGSLLNVSCGNTPAVDNVWETWDHRKGDVARTILYMDIRYEGGTGALGGEQDLIATSDLALMMVETTSCGDGYQDPAYHGVLSTLLAWHTADPVDADELRRNDQVWCYQGNRNPFVDHPEWVDCLYNNICSGGPVFGGIDSATDLDACADTGVQIDWTTPTDWNDGCLSGCSRGFHVYREGVVITVGGCADPLGEAAISCVDTNGTVGTAYTYSVEAFNNDGTIQDGGASVGAGDSTNDGLAPVITSGPTASPSSTSFSVSWQTDEVSDSFLEWGTVSGVYPSNTSDAADVSAHSLSATDLANNTSYFYRVCSTDPCGQGPICSAEDTVATTGGCTADAGEHPVFINELHYDNSSTDVGEFVEIAGPAGTDLSAYSIELYNGNGNTRYDTDVLSGTIDDEGTGYGAVALNYPRDGIQNGSPDGIALIQGGTVVQFLCYEGTITAADGTAVGQTCTNIGVQESSSTLVGDSLQLKGGPGFVYEDFSWTAPSAESPGSINAGQDMSCSAPPDQLQFFTATSTAGQVLLEWENSAIYPPGGTTRICRDPATFPTDPATCTIAGTPTEQAGSDGSYGNFVDATALTNDSTFFYSAWVVDSSGKASASKTVSARPFDTAGSAKWSYQSAASSLAPPGLWPGAVGTGAVFVVANDNNLHGVNPSDSGGQWPKTAPFDWRPMPMNSPAQQRPPVVPISVAGANLVVFLGSEDGHAYAVDGHTGVTLWQSPPLATMITGSVAGLFTAFGGDYDLLFVGSRDAGIANAMYGLNLADGSIAWAFDDGGASIGIISAGATVDYANNRLYFASWEHATGSTSTVWCLTFTDTGATLLWERALGSIDGAPILFDGRIYVGTNAGDVHALDAATGVDLWAAPFVTADGAVKGFVAPGFSALPRELVLATSTTVWALTDSGASVSQDWQQPGVAGPSIPLALDGVGVFVGSTGGRLYQLNEATGGVTSSIVLGDGTAVIGSPGYDYLNGMAYVGSESGAVFAVTLPLP